MTGLENRESGKYGPMDVASAIAGGVLSAIASLTQSPFLFVACLIPICVLACIYLISHFHLIYWIIIVTSPFNDHLGLEMGGVNLRPYSLLSLFGLGCILLFWAFRQHPALIVKAKALVPIFIPLILLVSCKVVTVMTLTDKPPAMSTGFPAKYIVFFALLYCTSFIVATVCTGRDAIKTGIRIWLHLSNLILFIAFMQLFLSNFAGYEFVHHRDVISFGRPYSVFREPDVLGSFVGASTLMIISLLIARNYLLSANYLYLTLGAHSVFLIILFVRAAWMGTMVGLGVWLLCSILTNRARPAFAFMNQVAIAGLVGVTLLLILVPSFSSVLLGRFGSLAKPKGESASEYRMRELETMYVKSLPSGMGAEELKEFLLGHGDFSWSYWAPQLLGENYDRSAVDKAKKTGKILVHAGFSMGLTTFFDNGALGILFTLLFFVLLSWRFYRSLRFADTETDRSMLYATFLPSLCLLVCFQFSYDPITPFFWALIGMFIAYSYEVEYSRKQVGEDHGETSGSVDRS